MTASLRSDIFVDALRRAVEGAGGFATVARKGHDAAGMIFVIIREGRESSLWTEDREEGWRERLPPGPEEKLSETIAQEIRFDPDLWVLDIEGVSAVTGLSVTRQS